MTGLVTEIVDYLEFIWLLVKSKLSGSSSSEIHAASKCLACHLSSVEKNTLCKEFTSRSGLKYVNMCDLVEGG